jgi:hypothetical protein
MLGGRLPATLIWWRYFGTDFVSDNFNASLSRRVSLGRGKVCLRPISNHTALLPLPGFLLLKYCVNNSGSRVDLGGKRCCYAANVSV